MSKLISWNIGSRVKDRRSAQLEWLASEHADGVALQEIAGAPDLQQRLSALGFEHFASTEPTDGRKKLVAIASREPLEVISPLAVPHPERAISRRLSLAKRWNCMVCTYHRVRTMEPPRFETEAIM